MSLKKDIVSVLVANQNGLKAKEICQRIGYPVSEYGVIETLISQINYNNSKWEGILIDCVKVAGGDDIYKLVRADVTTVAEMEEAARRKAKRITREIELCHKFSLVSPLLDDARQRRVTAAAIARGLFQNDTVMIDAMMNRPAVALKPVDEIATI